MRYIVALSMILLAAFSRILPHAPNVTPITAIALFSAVYLGKKYTFIVPLLAMLASDYVIGFYPAMGWVYGSFVAIGFLGLWLRSHKSVGTTAIATLGGSLLFFVVTNFGVWASSQVSYPHTLEGLGACYVAAIPFFRNTLLGDAAYVTVLFGAYELLRRYVPAMKPQLAGGNS